MRGATQRKLVQRSATAMKPSVDAPQCSVQFQVHQESKVSLDREAVYGEEPMEAAGSGFTAVAKRLPWPQQGWFCSHCL